MNNQFSFTIFVLPPDPSKGVSPPPPLRKSETISCNRSFSGSIPQKLSFDPQARALAIFVGSPVVKSFRPRAPERREMHVTSTIYLRPIEEDWLLVRRGESASRQLILFHCCEESFKQQEKLFRCRLVTCHLNHALPLCQYLPTKIHVVGGEGELVGVFCSFTLARNDKSQ